MFKYSYTGDPHARRHFSVWVRHDGFNREIARVADEVDAMELVATLEALDCTRAAHHAEDNA